MAATKYTYSISNDFPNGKVDVNRLAQEIAQSDISVALDYINTSGDDCDIWFKEAIPTSVGEGELDDIVAAHSGEPLPQTPAAKTSDGRPIIQVNGYGPGKILYFTGIDDDGHYFRIESNDIEDKVQDAHFTGDMMLAGGFIKWDGGGFEDTVDFEVWALATEVEDPGSVGQPANCVCYATPYGFDIIIPNPAGDKYVDGATAVPVPSSDNTGWWDLDANDDVVPNYSQKGEYNLFTGNIRLAEHINEFPIWDSGSVKLYDSNIKPSSLLHQWTLRVTVHNRSGNAIKAVFVLICGKDKGD